MISIDTDILICSFQIEGNEELVAKCSIFAAHNAAQLSAYVADLSNISTDIELSESK